MTRATRRGTDTPANVVGSIVASIALTLAILLPMVAWISFGDVYTALLADIPLVVIAIAALWYGQSSVKSAKAFITSRACGLCGNKIGEVNGVSRFFHTHQSLQEPQTFFHEQCYRETLRGQRRRCPNCNAPLYNPKTREFVVPVFLGERGQLFCSQKCSETYKPLEGLAVSLPTELTCPYCKSVYSSSLTKCPSCGATRTKPALNLLGLNPFQFEQRVAELLIRMGYSNVTRVGGSGDRAVDITAQRKDEFGQVLRYAVQCKRYDPSSHVGSTEMQVFCSMISRVHGSDRGIYVTTSSFTMEAAEIAQKFGVTLVDGKLLEELFVQYA